MSTYHNTKVWEHSNGQQVPNHQKPYSNLNPSNRPTFGVPNQPNYQYIHPGADWSNHHYSNTWDLSRDESQMHRPRETLDELKMRVARGHSGGAVKSPERVLRSPVRSQYRNYYDVGDVSGWGDMPVSPMNRSGVQKNRPVVDNGAQFYKIPSGFSTWDELDRNAGQRQKGYQESGFDNSPPKYNPRSNDMETLLNNQNRYKTELCISWKDNGNCRYREKCQFAHGEHELRPIMRHPKYKTEVCKTFSNYGTCPYGKRCRFLHQIKRNPHNEAAEQDYSVDSLTSKMEDLSMYQKEEEQSEETYPQEEKPRKRGSRLPFFKQLHKARRS
eukprot:TRINITY_DN94_c0_g1_i1.p1 TRINITY_DN94_c0_g1~~TRINITY_DN94_c0_g1_i1.p1  ORF type:complete len:329 (-),score=67.51 TRINITY_DN94_c0_g1_i1:108-1094(-)